MISAPSQTSNRFCWPAVHMTHKSLWITALLFPLVAGPVWTLAWNGHAGRFGTLSGLVLVSAILTAAVTDVRGHRIYNWTTYPAFLWAFAINIVAFTLAS